MENKPKTLVLISNHFPFGFAEAFIEFEYPLLAESFDRILILSRDVEAKEIRPGKYLYSRVNSESSYPEKLFSIILLLKHLKLVVRIVRAEIKALKKKKTLSIEKLNILIHDLFKALITSKQINQFLSNHNVKGNVVLYSYWLNSSALATLFVRRDHCSIKRISRAHGGDVYEERHPSQYLSFRNTLSKYLDAIYCISENGANHLREQIEIKYQNKIKISRLGVNASFTRFQNDFGKNKIILSCSFLVPVKRIDFLIESLAQLNERVRWIHIGDGSLNESLRSMAAKKLNPRGHVEFEFKGNMSSQEITLFYQSNPVYLFVNTSASEGIPVTIMEAQSFGVPVIALNIGGISEIVSDNNGRLLPFNATPTAFSESVTEILRLPENKYIQLQQHSRQNWQERYNAQKNFSSFADQISHNLNEV